MDIPAELKYSEDDEWIRLEGDIGTVGITDYAQDALSDVVYVELPAEGDIFDKGETFGVVESVKAAADLYMPLGGEIVEVNSILEDTPELVNSDPYGDAWIVKIKIADLSELDGLLDAAAYEKRIEERE
jgi:glycine cleavage system H protein